MTTVVLYTYLFSEYDNGRKAVDVLKRVTDKGEDYWIDIRSKFQENGEWRGGPFGVRLTIAEFRELTRHMPQGAQYTIESEKRRVIFEPTEQFQKYRIKLQTYGKDRSIDLYIREINKICCNSLKIINASMKS